MSQKKTNHYGKITQQCSWLALSFTLSLSTIAPANAQPVDATGAIKPPPGYGVPKTRELPPGYGQPRQLEPLPGYGLPNSRASATTTYRSPATRAATTPPATGEATGQRRFYPPTRTASKPMVPAVQPDIQLQPQAPVIAPPGHQPPAGAQIPFGEPSKPLPAEDGWIALPPPDRQAPAQEPVVAQPQSPAPAIIQPSQPEQASESSSAPILPSSSPAMRPPPDADFTPEQMLALQNRLKEMGVQFDTTQYASRPEAMRAMREVASELQEGKTPREIAANFEGATALTPEGEPDIIADAVIVADLPDLSEASRHILQKTPSGINMPQRISSPEPVVIRRENPNAGLIPKVDYRAHEEMGLNIQVRRPDFNTHRYLEKAYESLLEKKYEIAAGYYNEVLNAEPGNEMALFGLATTYHKDGRIDAARETYGRLLDIDPTHREGLNNFMALISEEAPGDAILELEKLEENSPHFSPIPAQIGVIYSRLGDFPKAIRKLTRALELSPENLSYKYNLAVALDKMGEKGKAADLYIELIEDYRNGATLPGDVEQIKNRAIFLSSAS